ncbi:MAG: hypothetical protein GXO92_01555 [FCB group bacterium]|nr:hypothetical protein [FCB group bacterium]
MAIKNKPGSIIRRVFPIFLIIPLSLGSFGCMHSGSVRSKPGMGMMMRAAVKKPDRARTVDRWGDLITTVINDLADQDLGVSSIAVLDIKSKSTEIDVEWIRQKLITELVALNRYRILNRDRIQELLREQGLGQTGVIDAERAVKDGKLIGVDSFMDGYVSIEDGKAVLSLQLIKTESSVILWASTVEK